MRLVLYDNNSSSSVELGSQLGAQNTQVTHFFTISPRKKSTCVCKSTHYNGSPPHYPIPWGAGMAQWRALASHECGPGSIPRLGVICGLSLLVLYSAPRGFLQVLRFPLSSKTDI